MDSDGGQAGVGAGGSVVGVRHGLGLRYKGRPISFLRQPMPTNLDTLNERFTELEKRSAGLLRNHPRAVNPSADSREFYAWAVSALNAIRAAFGQRSPHAQEFEAQLAICRTHWPLFEAQVQPAVGILVGAKDDLAGGHLYDIERSVTGEVVGDFVALAQAALRDGHHTVACVLASAALEDALKRYAAQNDLDVSDKTMEDVVNALKSKGLVSGPQKALLAAMPKLRNQAMHAKWENLTREDAGSMIGFVEQFLMAHFP
ncbi:MAG: DUF4145 domain-containing protein [Burkholderiaceae bacterium]